MKKVLVIYNMIPDIIKKGIVDMTDEEYEYYSKANNFIVNVDDDDTPEGKAGYLAAIDINNCFAESDEYKTNLKYPLQLKDTEILTDISNVEKLITCEWYF